MADVSPERLRRFFTKSNGGYQIVKQVRDLCIFAVQDVAKDPPFSRMDLIICRNLLIYLGVPLQKKVLATFHYALNPGRLSCCWELRRPWKRARKRSAQIDKKHKALLQAPDFGASAVWNLGRRNWWRDPFAVRRHQARSPGPPPMWAAKPTGSCCPAISPPGVLINSSFDILQFRGHTGPFLEPPPGHATLNLLKMAREGLALDLRAAIHQAKKSSGPFAKPACACRAIPASPSDSGSNSH